MLYCRPRLPSFADRTSFALSLGLLFASAGCGDSAGPGPSHANPTVGSPCQAKSDECGPDRVCAEELTGGAAYSILSDPLPAPEGYCSATCSSNADCGERGVCFGRGLLGSGGECRRACKSAADCGQGLECATAAELASPLLPDTCQPLPTPDTLGPNQTGARCGEDADCGDGYCKQASDKRGGYCSGLCIADANCGQGGVCIRGIYGARGSCEEACQTDADCQNDQMGWGCGPDKLCVRKAEPLPSVGEPCSSASEEDDCGSGSCRTQGLSGETYPGGYCIGSCNDDNDCGALGVCINELTCLRSCQDDTDCRPEYKCQVHPQATGDSRDDLICFPRPKH
ncbi:MAG: hypothetical protein QM778_09995 [Myxococcales bacterium]